MGERQELLFNFFCIVRRLEYADLCEVSITRPNVFSKSADHRNHFIQHSAVGRASLLIEGSKCLRAWLTCTTFFAL